MRSFESAGPDVKIRGTPSHIAEKYVALARDALSSGDPVLAENYLQHAEHYNRIILSYREQMGQTMDPYSNGQARTHTLPGPDSNEGDEFGEDESDEFAIHAQQQAGNGDGSQPPFQQQPRNFDNQNRYDNRQQRHDRGDRFNSNRHDRGDGPRFDRGDRQDFRGDRNGDRYRDDRRGQGNGSGDHQQGDGGYRRRDRYQGANGSDRDPAGTFQPPGLAPQPQASNGSERPAAPQPAQASGGEQEQPAFLRRPVRRPRRDDAEQTAAPAAAETEEPK
jgi:hypothetical protein